LASNSVNATSMALPAVDTGSTVLMTLGYLCLLLAIIFFAYWLLRRLGFHGMGVRSSGDGPQLLSRLMLGNRQSVAVVRYRDKDLVIGVTEDRVNLLKEFDADDREGEAPQPKTFASLLKRKTDDEE